MVENATQIIKSKNATEQNKVVSLFQYIKELNKLKQKSVLNVSEYPWARTISSFPDDPENILVFYRDRVEDKYGSADNDPVLLSVHKPEFDKCPVPDAFFVDWLEAGWDSFRNEARIKNKRRIEDGSLIADIYKKSKTDADVEEEGLFELFEDDPDRVESYNKWLATRKFWGKRQKVIQQTRNLFSDLYRLYFELQRDSETMELVVANGILCDRENPSIRHPVLTKRVKLHYDPSANTIFVDEVESTSELYVIAFQTMDDINHGAINQLQADLQSNDYHPLDRNDTPAFLKVLIHQLSSDSKFSEDGIPEKWMSSSRLLLYMDPCYIMRKRLDGTLRAIEQIIENVQETGYIPATIRDIVSGGKVDIPEDTKEESVEEQLAAVGGESVEVLLSKEANKEQLEIAKRIEQYNAVLVQGPPGTGKTHTIANLMGHFLAQGKSVLVTSQTPKALNVLKDKVAPGLQNLCVSVLEDSNADMERSVDGITDYMSRATSHEVKRELDGLASERKQIIQDLACVRRKIFQIINQECNCIVYNGEEISPSKAAAFVLEHVEDLSYIPGKVRNDVPIPLSFAELAELYRSNEELSGKDEDELDSGLPNPAELLSPKQFTHVCEILNNATENLQVMVDNAAWDVITHKDDKKISIHEGNRTLVINYPEYKSVKNLQAYIQTFGSVEPWMKSAAVDGKNGGAFRGRWETLIQQIDRTCEFAESIVGEQFGSCITFTDGYNIRSLVAPLEKLKSIFARKGKISKFTLVLNKDCTPVFENIFINGGAVQSVRDCDLALHIIELEQHRNQCALYWDELLTVHGVPRFEDLDANNPEQIASRWTAVITRYLNWYQDSYMPLVAYMEAVGLSAEMIFASAPLDSDIVATEKILSVVSTDLPLLCDILKTVLDIEQQERLLEENHRLLLETSRAVSRICNQLNFANESRNQEQYQETFTLLDHMYQKYDLQQKRRDFLSRLGLIAPQWAMAIKNREGIHGSASVPETIEEAWKWKQLSDIIAEITNQPFSQLQNDSIHLSKEYRKITARYAEKNAWYHLLRKTEGDIDMRHALQGWKQTVKKIGKGTGRNAPALKAKARELMSKCQVAVPSWIMPINRALESLNPKENCFDIIIIDEASQSDMSSLAILYMGKKLIIVGDDKQVSPMAVGVDIDKVKSLQQMYIQDKIPNAHLYDAKTSIYDIAKTTFQPLMLREHFRCVPEIIGFSNMLSYDYKIKPLRDASNSTLLPAVVNYRVADGKREHSKTNTNEAKAIVALMQACIEQPEYAGRSFGVISLLGEEQVKVVQRLIEENINHKDLIARSILCGNASNFQGDERDVIFLSMVDSGDGKGPIKLQGFGPDDAFRKRYNVAASRARDQLWVVDSLDAASDLKPGDIRKTLIDYSLNPGAIEIRDAEIEEKADSPFEVGVARALMDRGYHLVQQWKVGTYRIDMVAVCGMKTVAIECDGERYHSGESKIREDMERQTILERLGWRFIRIRGSEYFRDTEKTIDRVVRELSEYGVEPDAKNTIAIEGNSFELLERVKLRAAQILYGGINEDTTSDMETIEAALNPKSMVPTVMPNALETIVSQLPQRLTAETEKSVDKVVTEKESLVSVLPKAPPKQDFVKTNKHSQKINIAPKPRQEKAEPPVQQVLPDVRADGDVSADVTDMLKQAGIPYVDKRENGGALWIIGDKELSDFVGKCNSIGVRFVYKADGSRATKGKPGWWAK